MRLSSLSVGISLCLMAGCGEYGDVWPVVDSATIEVDRAAPMELADIQFRIGFDNNGGKRTVDVEAELLADNYDVLAALALEFPESFDPTILSEDGRVVTLVNKEITNGELVPLCGGTYRLRIHLTYLDHIDSGDGYTEGTFADHMVFVSCN